MYVLGIDTTEATVDAKFGLGQRGLNVTTAGVKEYVYVRDSGAAVTGAGYVVLINQSAFTAIMASTTTSAPGTGQQKPAAVAPVAVTASYYYWAQVSGPAVVRVAASCAAFTTVNTTGTAGQLDDDATAGAEVINGIALTTANGGAAATAAATLQYPFVGVTL